MTGSGTGSIGIRLFDDWCRASACVRHPHRDDAAPHVDWRWYGLARCRTVAEPALYRVAPVLGEPTIPMMRANAFTAN